MQFSETLSKLMRDTGTTAYRLAKEVGVSQSTIKNWLDGRMPSLAKAAKVAGYFVDYDALKLCFFGPALNAGQGQRSITKTKRIPDKMNRKTKESLYIFYIALCLHYDIIETDKQRR